MNLSGVQIGNVQPIELSGVCHFDGSGVFCQDQIIVDLERPVSKWELRMVPGMLRGPVDVECDSDGYKVRVSEVVAGQGYQSVTASFSPPLAGGEMLRVDFTYIIDPLVPLTFLRRSSGPKGLDTLSLLVSLPAVNLPRCWRTEWSDDTADAVVVGESPVEPEVTPTDLEHDIYTLEMTEDDIPPNKVIGFRWEW
jgi:hypothetical protein